MELITIGFNAHGFYSQSGFAPRCWVTFIEKTTYAIRSVVFGLGISFLGLGFATGLFIEKTTYTSFNAFIKLLALIFHLSFKILFPFQNKYFYSAGWQKNVFLEWARNVWCSSSRQKDQKAATIRTITPVQTVLMLFVKSMKICSRGKIQKKIVSVMICNRYFKQFIIVREPWTHLHFGVLQGTLNYSL